VKLVWLETLGFAAAVLTTSSFAPQVVQTRRTGGKDLSWSMLSLFASGVVLWLLYGICLNSWPIITANLLTICQLAAIAYFKSRA
jgi:MtN3 and saliva related transmembrane protein